MQDTTIQKPARRWRPLPIILKSLGTLAVLILGYGLLWLQPFGATDPALSAMRDGQGVTVSDTADLISFLPQGTPKAGFIFYPGARVDPRAYASYMRSFARQGYASFIVKMPYNIAFLGLDRANDVIAANPRIKLWGIGGHSLGGVAACSFAATNKEVRGVLLYGSYPSGNLSKELSGKIIYSVYGTNDGFTTSTDIEQSKTNLPPDTRYIAIERSTHSYFGNYGLQDGDGQPGVSREQAQREITEASLDFLNRLAASG